MRKNASGTPTSKFVLGLFVCFRLAFVRAYATTCLLDPIETWGNCKLYNHSLFLPYLFLEWKV